MAMAMAQFQEKMIEAARRRRLCEPDWSSPTTPEQQYLDAAIRSGDLVGARSFVENLTLETRQKITEDSSLMVVALRENKPEFIRFLVEECNAELEKSIKRSVSDAHVCDDAITPLRYAARFNKIEAVMELLRLGANVNAVSPNIGLTALHDACENGMLAIVRHLIQHGADLTIRGKRSKTALMYGVEHVDVCRELIEKGADINAIDDDKNTVLHVAVSTADKNGEVVKLLLENGADLFKKNDDGEDALRIACTYRATKTVKVMRDHMSGNEAMHQALIQSHQLLGACLLFYYHPLRALSRVAEALNEWKAAARLLEKTRQVIAAEDPATSTPNSAYDNAVEVNSMLKFAEMRKDENKIYLQGLLLKEKILGPSHRETIESVMQLAKFYITSEDYGRGVRLLGHCFKLSFDPSVDCILSSIYNLDELLLVMTDCTAVFKKQTIKKTLKLKDVYEFLEAVTVEAKRSGKTTPEDISVMDSPLNDHFMQITLLLIKLFHFLATNEDNVVQFRRLLRDFVRLNLRSEAGRTVLMKAICPDHPFDVKWFSSEFDAVKLLLECGADTRDTDNNGNSVLHLLIKQFPVNPNLSKQRNKREANKKLAEMFLAFGAHFDAKNDEGFSAVAYLESLGLKLSKHMTLQCRAVQVIRRHKIRYADILPKSLVHFVQMH